MSENFVPSFELNFSEQEIQYVQDAAAEVMRSGDLALGPYTDKFEDWMAQTAKTEHAVAVGTGSAALEILYKITEPEGKRILMPSNTNFATAAAAKNAGADIEFYDNGLYPDRQDLESRIRPDTAAVVAVHIGGYLSPELIQIAETCKSAGVPLIEDAAHAHGARISGKTAGSIGESAAFSSFLTKAITTGEGGAITTDQEYIAKLARQYRTQGRGADGLTHEVWGNTWRITELGAAIGLAQSATFEADTDERARIIRRYTSELGRLGIVFPELSDDARPSGHKAIAYAPDGMTRAGIKSAMKQRGVQMAREVYEKPLHQQPIFQEIAVGLTTYPIATDFAERHIALPLWRNMPEASVDTVIEAMTDVLHKG